MGIALSQTIIQIHLFRQSIKIQENIQTDSASEKINNNINNSISDDTESKYLIKHKKNKKCCRCFR